MGCTDDELVLVGSRPWLLLFLVNFASDKTLELRIKRRNSGVNCDPTGAPSPKMQYSSGGWLNFHNLNRRINALENTVWTDISSPVVLVHEILGKQDPNTSQIAISAPASSGTWI